MENLAASLRPEQNVRSLLIVDPHGVESLHGVESAHRRMGFEDLSMRCAMKGERVRVHVNMQFPRGIYCRRDMFVDFTFVKLFA